MLTRFPMRKLLGAGKSSLVGVGRRVMPARLREKDA